MSAITSVREFKEPESFTEAMQSEKASNLKLAMESEIKSSHMENVEFNFKKQLKPD